MLHESHRKAAKVVNFMTMWLNTNLTTVMLKMHFQLLLYWLPLFIYMYLLTFTLNLTCFLSYVSFVPWQMLCVNESAQRQVNYDLYQPISSCPNVKGV